MTKPKAKSSVSRAAATPYSSKIIKAGALISDTKTLLAHWHPTETVAENTARLRRENVFGKSSRSRVEDIVAIFRQRYMDEPSVTSALARLAQSRLPSAVLDRLLYFHSARSDRLLFEDRVVEMRQGDSINIPAHTRHRVEWASPDEPTVWLAVFYGAG